MNYSGAAGGWLSPTRAWRLIECPASVRPVAGIGAGSAIAEEVNSGTLAHRVLERWIGAEGYRSADPKATLAEAADTCAAELAGGAPSSWRTSRARLVARSTSLVDLIGDRKSEQVLSEIKVKDEDLRLRGQLDLLLLGDEIVVVDLESQSLLNDGLSESTVFQLTAYAHLIRRNYGALPDRAEVFSLSRGRIPLPLTDASVNSMLASLAKARSANPSIATPSPATCLYCDHRLWCGPHWDVAPEWPNTDAVLGEIARVEEATTGVSAVCLQTLKGTAWVNGIPSELVSDAKGKRVRLVRVRPLRTDAGDLAQWGWSRTSALEVL